MISSAINRIKLIFERFFDIKSILFNIKTSVCSNKLLYLSVLIYIILLSSFTILKHQNFLTTGYDLGIFNQAFWTTSNEGMLFYETADLAFNPGGSFFGVHFAPILFLLVPFYAIWPSPEILLVMQSVILAVGAFPVFWMSRDKLGENVGFVLSVVYLAYPALYFMNLNEFHLEAFTSTFFLFSVYYLEREKWPKFFLFFALALSTIEFAPIIGIFVAFYALLLFLQKQFKHPRKALKYILLMGSISVLVLVLALESKSFFNDYTSPIPTTLQTIPLNLTDLSAAISYDLDSKIFFIISLFGPLAFLPFLAPEVLVMALPWIGAALISSYPYYHNIYYHYNGFLIPFIFVALPKAIDRLGFYRTKKILQLFLICSVIFGLSLTVGSEAFMDKYFLPPTDRTELLYQVLPLIPSNASILTQNDIFPHVSNRAEAYMYLPASGEVSVDYILIDVASRWYDWMSDVPGDRIPPKIYVEDVLKNEEYGIFASVKSIFLLKKGYSGEPILFVPFSSAFNYQTLHLGSGSIVEDSTSDSGFILKHYEKISAETFWHGPYVDLMPGLYKATFAIKVDEVSRLAEDDPFLVVDVVSSWGQILHKRKHVFGLDISSDGQWFNMSMLFGLATSAEAVEFRGIPLSDLSISLDYIIVEQLSPQPITKLAFDSGSLVVDNGVVSDGVLVHSKGSGTFWYGPYVSLPAGDYVAKFWLKLDEPYNGSVIDLGISTNLGKQLVEILEIHSKNFTLIDTWQRFEVEFTLSNDSTAIEFPGLNVRQLAPVSLLLVEVYPNNNK
ncbi:DUF2079 domain-containing protein [Candidatus Bathyarchaeota archaeon]|nr:DUF2079 domain-containing protein [Candidatus Bathyarchaeota archaeon]